MWGYKKEEQKTRIACTLVANCKCYDGGVVACEEVFPSSFYIPWMSFWDLYKTCFAQPLFGFLCCNTTTTKPNHNPHPPGSREKPSSSFLRIQSKRKASQNKTKINPTYQSQIPSSPKTQSGVLWERGKRKEKIWWRREGYIATYPQRGKEWVLRSETPKAPKRFLTPPPCFSPLSMPQMTNTPTLSRSTSTNTSSTQQNTNV